VSSAELATPRAATLRQFATLLIAVDDFDTIKYSSMTCTKLQLKSFKTAPEEPFQILSRFD